jgi:hypothetical protein
LSFKACIELIVWVKMGKGGKGVFGQVWVKIGHIVTLTFLSYTPLSSGEIKIKAKLRYKVINRRHGMFGYDR